MTAATHLIRVEGVNLYAVLDDTNDIGVRRGASAMLRTAARGIPKAFPTVRPVTFEASVGIFETATDDPDSIVEQIAAHLSRGYPHVTFVVDAASLHDGYAAALDEAWARNRFRQFQQLTVAVPTGDDLSGQVCALDRVRPAIARAKQGQRVSRSVDDRLDEGRTQRQRFLRETLGDGYDCPTTDHLLALAEDTDRRYGNLAEKLAVIYLDGNRFGKLKQAASDAGGDPRILDDTIQGYRKAFLRDLIASIRYDPDFLNDGSLRLEILLWGGDEIAMIVPAWKGMETLQRFYEASADWAFREQRLTHAGGIVFCSYKTPIAEATHAVVSLVEHVKSFTRDESRFDYLVLESIDYPTQAIQRFRELRYGVGASALLAPLAPLAQRAAQNALEHLPWEQRIGQIAAFLERLPRGALYEIAQAWVRCASHPGPATRDELDALIVRLVEVNGKGFLDNLHRQLFDYFVPGHDPKTGHHHAGWLHLAELWDYLAPLPRSTRRAV